MCCQTTLSRIRHVQVGTIFICDLMFRVNLVCRLAGVLIRFQIIYLNVNNLSIFQAEALDLDKTVLDTVAEVAEDWRLDDIKGLLGRCNFKADMLDRKVSLLSGGEKVMI